VVGDSPVDGDLGGRVSQLSGATGLKPSALLPVEAAREIVLYKHKIATS